MVCRTCLIVLLLLLVSAVASRFKRELCIGIDVSRDPRIEARQLDGLWHSQGTISSRFPSISFIVFQDQGKLLWFNDWNITTSTCSFRKWIINQSQSIQNGPYSPCFGFKQILPVEGININDLVYFPTKNLLMFYTCFGNVRPNGICSETPFVRVMTRTLYISRKELDIIDRRLRRLGESINSITFVNPSENGCRRPMQKNGRSRRHRRRYDRFLSRGLY